MLLQEISILPPPHRRDSKFQGGGVSKTPKFKATYVAKSEFPWGGGGVGYSLELHIAKNRIYNITSLYNLYTLTLLIYLLWIFLPQVQTWITTSISIKAVFFLMHTCSLLPHTSLKFKLSTFPHTSLKFKLSTFCHYYCVYFLFVVFPWNPVP